MNPKLNIDNYVRQLLPWHKRLPARLALLRALLSPLRQLFDVFDQWRHSTRLMMNVSSQVRILEGYLQDKYSDVFIRVVTYDEQALTIGLEEEGDTHGIYFPYDQEEADDDGQAPEVPLEGELREVFGDADFIVYIPQGIEIEDIRADIERFREALIKYKIIQQ
mgnify:CR=1 FL=1